MPVDRKLRDQLADILAAYLRGQDGKELRQQLREMGRDGGQGGPGGGFPSPEVLPETADEDAKCLWIDSWMSMRPGTVACSASEWASHCRDLAFLKSDRELAAPASLADGDISPAVVRAARWHLLAVAFAVALSFRWGIWLYLAVSATSCALFVAAMNVRGWRADRLRRADCYDPFRDRQDWEAHRNLLDDLRIPEYDPAIHGEPLLERCRWKVLLGSLTGCGILLSLTMAPFWPLWLLGIAFFSGRKEPAPTADRGKA